jgi:4-amino-4-deoxy-L-arabinose transferase-like glycosyltransferase
MYQKRVHTPLKTGDLELQLNNTSSQLDSLLYKQYTRVTLALNIIFTALAIYFLWILSNTSDINPDGGYYLSISRDIGNGLIPYKDVLLSYPPLTMYIMSLAGIIKDNPEYSDYLNIVFLFEILSCFLVYKITYFINKDRATRYLISIITLFIVLSFEGIYVILEPFVIFFALLSLYFYLLGKKGNYFLLYSGISAGMCFLSKQYGLSVSAAIVLSILLVNKLQLTEKLKMLLFFSLGFLVPLTLFYVYFIILHGISVSEMIEKLSGQGYGYKSPLLYIIKLVKFLWLGAPYIFLLPLMFFYKTEKKEIFFSIVIFLIFMSMPFYFKVFKHYFILLIPFCTIAGFYLINSSLSICKNKQHLNIFHLILTLTFLGFFTSTYFSIKNNFKYIDLVNRDNQLQLLGQINNWVPKKSEVLLVADQAIYFINDLKVPDINKVGYIFLKHSDNSDEFEELAQTAQYAITDESYLARLQQKGILVISILEKNDFIFKTDIGDNIKIWEKQI